MHGVFLVPNQRRDILWLNSRFEMNHTIWNNVVGHWKNPDPTSTSDAPVAGVFDDLSGTFTSPPVAVETDGNHLHVFGLGTDYAVYHKTFDATNHTTPWTPNWERVGGNFMCTPVVVSTGPSRIDLFGLDIDQSMVHSTWNGTSWSAFDELGGCFSGTPVVLPTADGKFDIFARAIDYKLYRLAYDPAVLTDWQILGGGLLGEPVAASAPAAVRVQQRIFVFVVGDDGAMWTTFFDGRLWRPWSSLGILAPPSANGNFPGTTFATEPVAIWSNPQTQVILNHTANDLSEAHAAKGPSAPTATGAAPTPGAFFGRIDLYGTGTDGAIWHIAFDSTGWQKGWESLGGAACCAPSVMGALPSTTIGSAALPPLEFSLLEPGTNSVVKLRVFDGKTWSDAWPVGPIFSQPNAFTIAVTEVDIAAIRSLRKDTDTGTANLSVGRWPMATDFMDLGDVTAGKHIQDSGMSFSRVSVELAEPFVYFYIVMNRAIRNSSVDIPVAAAVAQAVSGAAEDFLKDSIKKELIPDPKTTFQKIEGFFGIKTGADAGSGAPFILESLGVAAAVIGIDLAITALTADCDGTVASGTVSFKNGRILQQQVGNAPKHTLVGSIHSPGTNSPSGCGGNSDYTVKYEISWMGL